MVAQASHGGHATPDGLGWAPPPHDIAPLPETAVSTPTNRLADEKSPYLLQHAHNPVDWYPWGDEALRRARDENKPIFLSIGYSTCHWCHVMERESFENEEIATLMNAHYVCIKVDREERPDLDEIYMAAVQAMTGQGGWPLSAWLTPDLKPFYTGTYFPPDDRFGRPGFPRVLEALANAWRDERSKVVEQGDVLTEALQGLGVDKPAADALDDDLLSRTYEQLAGNFDARFGGWGGAPKFPRADFGALCLRVFHRTGDERALSMVRTTLDGMARAGLFDHLGGGFARYATDDRWLVPHFEKMLYDNAQLAFHYCEGVQITGREDWSAVVRMTLDYVLRDMTHDQGGFFSAEDADSEGEEGKFYVWSRDEIAQILTPDEREVFTRTFGVTEEGNWEGKNVLERVTTFAHVAESLGLELEVAHERIESAREKLFQHRAGRVRPGLDDKILTSWNGLMIRAFARASVVLEDERYRVAAARAADFVLDELRDSGGALLRRWRDGDAAIAAFAEDYAFFVAGLLELYQADLDPRWLDTARELHDTCFLTFGDAEGGALFNTREAQADLIVRTKAGYDGSVPTANSIAAANALTLFEFTGDATYRAQAEGIARTFAGVMKDAPMAMVSLVLAIDTLQNPAPTVVISTSEREEARRWISAVRRGGFHPDLVVAHAPAAGDSVPAALGVLEGREAAEDGSTRAFVCRGFACEAPTGDENDLVRQIAPSQVKS